MVHVRHVFPTFSDVLHVQSYQLICSEVTFHLQSLAEELRMETSDAKTKSAESESHENKLLQTETLSGT